MLYIFEEVHKVTSQNTSDSVTYNFVPPLPDLYGQSDLINPDGIKKEKKKIF